MWRSVSCLLIWFLLKGEAKTTVATYCWLWYPWELQRDKIIRRIGENIIGPGHVAVNELPHALYRVVRLAIHLAILACQGLLGVFNSGRCLPKNKICSCRPAATIGAFSLAAVVCGPRARESPSLKEDQNLRSWASILWPWNTLTSIDSAATATGRGDHIRPHLDDCLTPDPYKL
jgi:hypothetical protein